MAVQPQYHWQFTERQGTTVNTENGLQSGIFKTALKGHGRIGNAVHLKSKDSYINLGKEVGQFGTSDFTVAFGMRNISNHDDKELDIIGDQTMKGHGNFFSVRLTDGRIFFHVDENSKAKHYVHVKTSRLSMLPNRKWFHVAVVRKGKTIQIYIDGVLAAEAKSKTGVANINNNVDVKLGHSRRGTPNAQYEDLRIYHTALSATEVKNLLPSVNRPLRPGEIELVATDDATVILRQDVKDLSHFSNSFKKLRVGKNTGVTLYQQKNFEGIAQRCYADLPDIQLSLLESFPSAIRIWSAVGEPFTGKWVIKAPNGQFLSLSQSVLSTAPQRSFRELVRFHYNLHQGQLQLLPGSPQEGAALQVSPSVDATPLFVEELENLTDEFFITNQTKSQWLELGEDDTFNWTVQKEKRAVFVRVAKRAANENQVGELATGEVALYKHRAYYGSVWILSDSEKDQSGSYKRLADFEDLNDQTSSIRLGPNTGVTLFRHFDHQAAEDKREEEIEDIVENVHRLSSRQIGQDNLSSLQIFRTISPEDIFASYSTKLSQDYRMVGDNLEEFSAYRTILRFEPGAGEVEISATDLTKIEVEDTTYEIDERRSVTLKPNELNLIMITSEADGLNTPGLKIRTSEMAPNEHVVIFPNQEVQQQIAELEEGALWNATDTQGNLIVDHKVHSKEEVASVQNTIKRVMETVTYTNGAPTSRSNASEINTAKSRVVSSGDRNVVLTDDHSRVQVSTRAVSSATIDNPWKLELKPDNNNQKRAANVSQLRAIEDVNSKATTIIQEVEISQDEFTRLLKQAIPEETTSAQPPLNDLPVQVSSLRIGNPFKKVGDAVKKATSVVIGVVEDGVNVIVNTTEGVFKFVIDTAEKVVEFVEAVVETVVKGIKKFIEFLQFLFNWNDILDTQKYLVRALNDGFEYTAQQIEALKAPVSNFMDGLQETVEEAMNQLITTLGGDSSEASESVSQLPEAVEWFLSKLLGGSQKDDAKPTPRSAIQPSGDSKIEHFLFHFNEACADDSEAVLQGFEVLDETITTLITDPLKPQMAVVVLVETLKDVVIQLLEAVENLALDFLDAIAEAIEQLKNILNAEIKIPFISKLFRLIGGGKLTPLNLTGLLLAIPVTVVSKLIIRETPFKDEPPLDFSTPTDAQLVAEPQASLQRTSNDVGENGIALSVVESGASIQAMNNAARKKSIFHWGNTGLHADALNGIISAYLDAVPENADEYNEKTAGSGLEIVSLVLDGFSWLASFPSSPNFPGGRPYNLAHDDHKVSKTEDEQEYWERVMWGWRTSLYWLDVLVLTAQLGGTKLPWSDTRKLQRLKRTDKFTIGFFFAWSIVDAGLAIRYLDRIPKEDKPGLEIANEVVSWLPNMSAPLRLSGPKGAAALSIVDIVAAFSNYQMGSKLLANDVTDL